MKTYIVIGAGILGASTAYHLAMKGAVVTLIDRQDQGQATDAAAGIICPWLSQRRNQAWYTLAKAGAKYYANLISQLESDGQSETGYQKVGAISVNIDKSKLDILEERAYKRHEDAPEIGEITRLSATETKSLFPPLSEQFSSVHISGAARVNGRALRESLVIAAQKHGTKFIKGDATLIFQENKITGIKVGRETLFADQVIVTAGAWARELLKPIGMNFLVSAQKAQIVHLHMAETDTSKWPVLMPPNDQYILAFDDGQLVIGATHENDKGFDQRVTAGGLFEILNKALSVAPGLENCTVLETRVGFRPFTPGFLPVIGPLPHYEGILIANGLGASGLTVGPYLGAELAKLALNEPLDIDLSQYDVASAIEELN